MAQRWLSLNVVLVAIALLTNAFGCGLAPSVGSGELPSAADHSGSVASTSPPTVTGTPEPSGSPTAQERPLIVPEWMATSLASSDVHVRLQALDQWGQTAPVGAVDPC